MKQPMDTSYPDDAGHVPAVFTKSPVPFHELMKRQGISGPQGLAAFADSEWEPNEESRLFLEAIFAESE